MSEAEPHHEPVLVAEVLQHLDPQPGAVILDGTVGLGGHARELLPRLAPDGRCIGIDWDPEMVAVLRQRLTDPNLALHVGNYADFPAILQSEQITTLDGALLDLGVNSAQLTDPHRGFAFDHEGPLDMRFNPDESQAALELVNRLSEAELANLFYEFGQETQSRRVAKRICQVRHEGRITTTRVLATAVASALGTGGKTNPATRVFQALRIAVNRELDNLTRFLAQITDWLKPGGRLVVISFHSLEDRIVKGFLRDAKNAGTFEERTKRPVIADPAERRRNPRSRSAKLRAATRLTPE